MTLKDDGDTVRGLGFVTLYAAYMEEAVDECAQVLLAHDPGPPERFERQPISERAKYVGERLKAYAPLPEELDGLPNVLNLVADAWGRRNEVIHGRIYGGLQGEADELRPGRKDGAARPISSVELYQLANELFSTLAPLNQASTFTLHRLLANARRQNS